MSNLLRTENAGKTMVIAIDTINWNAAVADEIEKAIELAGLECERLVLDLERVEFIDSAGLGTIKRLDAKLNKRLTLIVRRKALQRCIDRLDHPQLHCVTSLSSVSNHRVSQVHTNESNHQQGTKPADELIIKPS